jgi:hypothetical protein
MEKQVELIDRVNFVVDFVLLRFQKRIDEDPKNREKNKLSFSKTQTIISLLYNEFQFHMQHHH